MKLQKSKTGYYILLWLVAIIFFLPVLWIVLSAFKIPSDILAWPPKVFFKPTLDNFRDLFGREIFLNAFFNSIFISLASIVVAIIAGILVGALCGFCNGVMSAKLGLPPMIATLSMQMITKGLSLVFSECKPVYFSDCAWYQKLATGSFLGVKGFYNAIIILLVLAIISYFLFAKTLLHI